MAEFWIVGLVEGAESTRSTGVQKKGNCWSEPGVVASCVHESVGEWQQPPSRDLTPEVGSRPRAIFNWLSSFGRLLPQIEELQKEKKRKV